MHTLKHCLLTVVLTGSLVCAASTGAQTPRGTAQSPASKTAPRSPSAAVLTVDQVIDRVVARERDEVATSRQFDPVIEIYIQDMKTSGGAEPALASDHYYLGTVSLSNASTSNRFIGGEKEREGHESAKFGAYNADNFVRMAYLDPNDFDRQHYEFDYVRREALGDIRCYVFDVTPLPDTGDDRFIGRIWAEDQNFTIVRFNGVHGSKGEARGRETHFDSWRLNFNGKTWLPAYIYAEESSAKEHSLQFKSQTRFWGYGPKNMQGEAEPQEANASGDSGAQDNSGKRMMDELQQMGLVAPHGELDHIMEIVVNNLEVTNNLDIQPEIRCRTLLTTSLESFSVGHTIVLSRGLLDALPDEASLAAMIAQEMATILAPPKDTGKKKPRDFTSLLSLTDSGHFMWPYNKEEIQAASQKSVDLLRNSPYKAKLDSPGLFLQQVSSEHKVLSALISPRIGDRANLGGELASAGTSSRAAGSGHFIAARMGTRVKLDPWSGQVTLLKATPVAASAREYDPFEIFPFFPFLTRDQGQGAAAAAHGASASGTKPSSERPAADSSTPGTKQQPTPPPQLQ
jgi:hypothetical protein